MEIILNNTINLLGKEDYSQVGNSRIGGNPDLPIEMNYPVFESGFYEFILQINLSDFKIEGFPEDGLISIFYGNLDDNEAIAYHFNEIQNLEKKLIPIDIEFAGVTNFGEHIPYKIEIREAKPRPLIEIPELNNLEYDQEEKNNLWKLSFLEENSYLLQEGLQDKNHIYLKSHGFSKLLYGPGIKINSQTNEVNYYGRNPNKKYININDLKECERTKSGFGNIENYNEWLYQLEKFESEKVNHIEQFGGYKCILSLASITETRMTWGDLHKLEFYGIAKDLLNKSIVKLNSTIP